MANQLEDDMILFLVRELSTQPESYLPVELVAMIAGEIPTDIIKFRSVCRSWRLGLGNIGKKLFPLKVSFS